MNLDPIKIELDSLRGEFSICKRKLDSKCEALLILSKDLDQCRQERDQFKLMAEQVQARYQALKRQLAGVGPRVTNLESVEYAEMKQQSLPQLLCEMREVNKSLQFEVDDLRQKLRDAQGDIKLLREQIARQRMGTTDEGMNTRHFPAHEREELVKKLETSHEEFVQLERDLQQVLDEKEDLETERDAYKNKYDRLNQELNFILKGDENRVVDIDALIMENKYLQQRLKQMEEEKSMAMATVSKYKTILEKKKNKGILKLGQQTSRSGGVVISQKQVHQLLENKSCLTPTPQTMADLQSLASALLESLNDKNMALTHQKKTNKILGTRVYELEKKLKTLEVSGLWNIPEKASSLEKLKQECEEIKTLMPTNGSNSFNASNTIDELDEEISPESSLLTSVVPSPLHSIENKPSARANVSELLLEDLDLLPTKEESQQPVDLGSESSFNSSHLASPLLSPTGEATILSQHPEKNTPDETFCNELQILVDVATKKFSQNPSSRAGSFEQNDSAPNPHVQKTAPVKIIEIDNDLLVDEFIDMGVEASRNAVDIGNLLSRDTDDDHHGEGESEQDESISDVLEEDGINEELTSSGLTSPQCNSPLLGKSSDAYCDDDTPSV